MRLLKSMRMEGGTPIRLPDTRKIWAACIALGVVLWLVALVLWIQQGIDEAVLFHFDPQRIAMDPVVLISKYFSSYGMAAITVVFILYLLLSQVIPPLDAPLTVWFYTICSFGISGIAGDLLKMVLDRPRPLTTYANEIIAISRSATPSIPSGHATKSIALVLPFLLLVANSRNINKATKIVVGLIAAGVCFSRVVLGAHYVSDVVAGIGMALVGLPLSMMFANIVLRRAKQEQLPFLSKVWGFLLVFLTFVFMSL